jgi:hypothetical protein
MLREQQITRRTTMNEWEAEIENVPTAGSSGWPATDLLVAAVGSSIRRSICIVISKSFFWNAWRNFLILLFPSKYPGAIPLRDDKSRRRRRRRRMQGQPCCHTSALKQCFRRGLVANFGVLTHSTTSSLI